MPYVAGPQARHRVCHSARRQGRRYAVARLERHKKFLRGEVAHRIDLRYAPELRFRLDESFDVGGRIDELLRQPEVKRDLEED